MGCIQVSERLDLCVCAECQYVERTHVSARNVSMRTELKSLRRMSVCGVDSCASEYRLVVEKALSSITGYNSLTI